MSEIDDLSGRVRGISTAIREALKSEPTNSNLAGWGQFLESTSPVFQIGPYGTAAGVLTNEVAFPGTPVDDRVKRQLRAFWDEKPVGKLFPQNVRLAFTLLALAKTGDSDLAALRDEVATELRNRQLADGSWSDATPHATSPAGGQSDATAWAVLALQRSGGSDVAMQSGAAWLAARVHGSGAVNLLSNIGTAAAIVGLNRGASLPALRKRGFKILKDGSVSREESISFFDYDQLIEGIPVQTRDYLCFPAFYPLVILINALSVEASFGELIRLDAYRADAVRKLIMLTDGHPYRTTPTARFSSTVDQAIYALSYEQLVAAEKAHTSQTSIFVPIYKWGKTSLMVNFVMPLIIVSVAMVTVAEPTTLPLILQSLAGRSAAGIVRAADRHKPLLQAIGAIIAALCPALPAKGRDLLSSRFRKT